jgi:trimethylamine--corrinoid protein Co-methyltransferase
MENAIKSIGPRCSLYGRKGTGLSLDGETKFTPSGTGVGIIDALSRERRASTSKDVENLVRIQESLQHVDIVRPIVTATDYPAQYSDLVEFYQLFKHTTKPFLHRTLTPDHALSVLEIAEIVAGGSERLRQAPIFGVVYCPLSPLSFSGEALQSMFLYAEKGIPILILSMAMGGATAPATLAGELLLINAEVLGTLALLKTLWPAVPLLYGSVSSVLDMKTGILALGAPERGILNLWCARMACYYGLPSVVGGLSTDAYDVDVQAGFEKALTAMPLLNEASVIFGMGVMDSANSYSYEQLVLDNEFVAALKRVSRGLELTDGAEELELIKAVGPKKNYLLEPHTVRHCRDYWRSSLFRRSSSEHKDIIRKAREKWQEIVAKEPISAPIDPQTDTELVRLLQKKTASFPMRE